MATRDITLKGLTDLELELLCRWINEAPTTPYAPMLVKVQSQLPLEVATDECDQYIQQVTHKSAAVAPSSADRSCADSQVPGTAHGVLQLTAHTPKGRERLPDVLRSLLRVSGPTERERLEMCRIPHGEDLL